MRISLTAPFELLDIGPENLLSVSMRVTAPAKKTEHPPFLAHPPPPFTSSLHENLLNLQFLPKRKQRNLPSADYHSYHCKTTHAPENCQTTTNATPSSVFLYVVNGPLLLPYIEILRSCQHQKHKKILNNQQIGRAKTCD